MRKTRNLLFIFFILFVTGCTPQTETANDVVSNEFTVNSIKWGSSWESVKEEPQLNGYNIITDDGNQFAIELNDFEFLGQKGKLAMLFSESENSFPASGFVQAYFVYDESVEKEIIEAGEKIYGERKSFYLDENGVENPLNPSAWYSEETLKASLSEEEKQEYLKLFEDKNYDESRIDALLRGPLVIITVEEDQNMIKFQGNDAAIVENFKK